jgi:hypothetical protein
MPWLRQRSLLVSIDRTSAMMKSAASIGGMSCATGIPRCHKPGFTQAFNRNAIPFVRNRTLLKITSNNSKHHGGVKPAVHIVHVRIAKGA